MDRQTRNKLTEIPELGTDCSSLMFITDSVTKKEDVSGEVRIPTHSVSQREHVLAFNVPVDDTTLI